MMSQVNRIIKIDSNDSDFIRYNIYGKYAKFEETNFSSIILNGEVKSYYNQENGQKVKEKGEAKVKKDIHQIRILISQTMHALKEVDDSIDVSDYYAKNTKDQIYKRAKLDIKGRSVKVNLATYRRLYKDQCFQKDGKWYVRMGKYTYNITDGDLTINSTKKSIKVNFYMPSNCSDISNLNTVTAFTKDTGKYSDCLVIIPTNVDSSHELIAHTTRFANAFANTNRTECKNVIVGGSRYGAYSIQMAADYSAKATGNSKNLYDTVVCVNNAAIVKGKNAREGLKAQITEKQLKNLDGIEFYFVSASGDPNMHKNKNASWKESKSPVSDSYLCSGIKLILNNCPHSEVYMVTNSDKKKEFANLSSSKRYHYEPGFWSKFGIEKRHVSHTYGGIIINLMNDGLLFNSKKAGISQNVNVL